MKRKVRIAPRAMRDLARLERFLGALDSAAAERMILELGDAVRSLTEQAERGRPGPYQGSRELALRFGRGGHVLRYQVRKEEVVSARIWHSREQKR